MIGDILDFRGIELEQEITALFEKGWIRLFVCGDLEDVLEHLNAPKETQFSRVRDLPASIFERYTGKYTDTIEKTPIVRLPTDNVEDPYNSFLLQQTFGRLMDPPQKKISQADDSKKEDFDDRPKLQETVRRVESKIGRNDPCPCGSGKKYKKCHGA